MQSVAHPKTNEAETDIDVTGPQSTQGSESGASSASNEVTVKATRRRFTAKYKLRILRQADACKGPGELGTLLRREGLYSSHLSTWRKQQEQGVLTGLTPKKRGPKANPDTQLSKENDKLRREVARLHKQLKNAETIIEFQKKACDLLGITQDNSDSDENE